MEKSEAEAVYAKPSIARHTETLFSLAKKIPWLFPQKFLRLDKDQHSESYLELENKLTKTGEIVSASLLADKTRWESVNIVIQINREELNKITSWLGRQDRLARRYPEPHHSSNLHSASMQRLGLISFGDSDLFTAGNIEFKNQTTSRCYMSALNLSKGITFLSMHFAISSEANKKIFNLDVKEIRAHRQLVKLNPFHKNNSIKIRTRLDNINHAIIKNTNKSLSEVKQAAIEILKACKIEHKSKSFVVVADFYRESGKPYFYDPDEVNGQLQDSLDIKPHSKDTFFVIDPQTGSYGRPFVSDDKSEIYHTSYGPNFLNFHAFYLKSEAPETADTLMRTVFLNIPESYIFLSTLTEISLHYEKCMSMVSDIFFKKNKSTKQVLEKLISASLEINLIEEKIKAVEEMTNSVCDQKYQATALRWINHLKKNLTNLKNSINKRKDLNNGEIQLKNLTWTKRYSILIFILVIIQIFLSIINVDWTKEGINKNPIYLNLLKPILEEETTQPNEKRLPRQNTQIPNTRLGSPVIFTIKPQDTTRLSTLEKLIFQQNTLKNQSSESPSASLETSEPYN